MRNCAIVLLLAGLLASAPARAVICTVDEVPAATLLLPYFEVDLGEPVGPRTLFSVNNASATAVLAHVVVWSDLSVPVLDFNIYLTGYDVQTINLRDVLARHPAADRLGRAGPERHHLPAGAVLAGHQLRELHRAAAAAAAAGVVRRPSAACR